MKAIALALAMLTPGVAPAAPCDGPVCNFETLGPWADRMSGASEPGRPPVHILQVGDSHTAGDAVTGAWRGMVQGQFGGGGRGVLPPGRPYAGYQTRGVSVSMSPGWRIDSTFGKGARLINPLIGMSGFALTSTAPGQRMALKADTPEMAFDRVVLCAFAGMYAKSVTVRTDAGEQAIDLTSDIAEPRCATLHFDTLQMQVELIADAGPVTITSWATFRDNGGVAVSNLGIVGSQLLHFSRTDDAVLREEMRAYAPDLIVLAFGTNEGFGPRIDAVAYEAVLRGQIERLRTLAPGVPILLLGPPDALSRNAALRGPGAVECGDGLFTPAGLDQVRRVQRKVASEMAVAWWDWQARMGGICSARSWVTQAPVRMRGDYVHFNATGGEDIAVQLLSDISETLFEKRS
ncbi:GDSL-type esterase/lipase family protein [Sphingomonas sp. G-3-2-10]|uniref:GDSL-type esterase/lipase family protein n=1 Tax=Sphingomonas sp. G-3-2-10 TaxID=2728838 RepID=UPI0032167269